MAFSAGFSGKFSSSTVTFKDSEKLVVKALTARGAGSGFVWISTPEPVLFDRVINRAKKTVFKDRVTRFDGSALTGQELLDEINAMDLYGGDLFAASSKSVKHDPQAHRLFIVRGADALKNPEVLWEAFEKAHKAGQEPWEPTTLLLHSQSIDGRKKLPSALKKRGLLFELTQPKGDELKALVAEMATQLGLQLAPEALALLLVTAEDSLTRLSLELTKLSLYVAGATAAEMVTTTPGITAVMTVTAADVEAVVTRAVRFEMAELVKSVIEGYRTRSLLLANHTIKSADDALGFVGFMTWAIKSPEKFRWNKRPTAGRLMGLTQDLVALDYRLKSSPVDVWAQVDAFIVENTKATPVT